MQQIPITEERHEQLKAALRATPLFRSLGESGFLRIVAGAALVRYDVGEVITREAEPTDYLYVLLDGHASVSVKRRDGVAFEIGKMRSPESFGEVGLLLNEPRTASVTADGSLLALRVERSAFASMFSTIPGFGLAVAQGLAYRLQLLTHQVAITEYDRARLGLALEAVTPSHE